MKRAPGRLWVEYLPVSRLAHQTPSWRVSVLGAVVYGVLPRDGGPGFPTIAVDTPPLPDGEGICEVWHGDRALKEHHHGAIHYRHDGQILFGCLSLPEPAAAAGSPLQATAEAAYREIFALLAKLGYPSLLRIWNYFPAINTTSHGLERYRQFNIGRQDAFLDCGRSVIGNVPAACALGSASGDLTIAFLAFKGEVTGIENPRQVSAFLYPSQYGPRSPTFSRAGLARLEGQTMLFISGTASIVGHQTLHPGDVAAQTRESMNNIDTVVEEARRQAPGTGFGLSELAYKVYVRHPADRAAVSREMENYVGVPVRTIYLQADVCRADLLVEIEASGGHPIAYL